MASSWRRVGARVNAWTSVSKSIYSGCESSKKRETCHESREERKGREKEKLLRVLSEKISRKWSIDSVVISNARWKRTTLLFAPRRRRSLWNIWIPISNLIFPIERWPVRGNDPTARHVSSKEFRRSRSRSSINDQRRSAIYIYARVILYREISYTHRARWNDT